MSDERPAGQAGSEDVGADTEKFRAFVREGEELERTEGGKGARAVVVAVIAVVVVAALLLLLAR